MKYLPALLYVFLLACSASGLGGFPTDSDAGNVSACPSQDNSVRESGDNYTFSNSCTPLQGVSVTIAITQNVVTTNGFGFQLNADGMLSSNVGWQQYVMAVDPSGNLYATVDNWDSNNNQIFNQWNYLFKMPQTGDGIPYVPAGYEFSFSLLSDSNSNIIGCSYAVIDGNGDVVGNYILWLNSLNQYDGGAYSSKDIGPIGDVTLDVVGFDNSQNTTFTSGGGNIIYHASGALSVTNGPNKSCVYHFWTAESSNSLYGTLPTYSPSGDWVQSFTYCP